MVFTDVVLDAGARILKGEFFEEVCLPKTQKEKPNVSKKPIPKHLSKPSRILFSKNSVQSLAHEVCKIHAYLGES